MVRNPPSKAGDAVSIPGRGTKIPHAVGQLSLGATTIELAGLDKRAHALQTTEPRVFGAREPQLEKENPQATMKTQHNQKKKNKFNQGGE